CLLCPILLYSLILLHNGSSLITFTELIYLVIYVSFLYASVLATLNATPWDDICQIGDLDLLHFILEIQWVADAIPSIINMYLLLGATMSHNARSLTVYTLPITCLNNYPI
ncbi:hypothetical protein ACJX0J_014325, partial [Zea mays]